MKQHTHSGTWLRWLIAMMMVGTAACSDSKGTATLANGGATATQDAKTAADSGAADTGQQPDATATVSDAQTDALTDALDDAAQGTQSDAQPDVQADTQVDAQQPDAAPDTATDATVDAKADAAPDVPPPPKGVPNAKITAPASGTVIEVGKPIDLAGMASDTLSAPTALVATWSSDKDGILGTVTPDAQGVVKWTVPKLSPGKHLIQLEVKNPQGVSAADSVALGVCSWASPESFDTKLDGAKWKIYGDAYWDPGGWLEMTGNAQSKFGKIWNIADYVQPGDVQISFKIATGGGMNGGADGFALSVIDAKDVAELESILNKAGNGGCLGYGVAGGCGTMKISAFHVEIDTFHNTGDPNTDPTFDNHIAVTLDGDPSNHWLWAPTPTIEDLQWHTVTVEVKGANVRVTLDGNELFNKPIPDFKFRGGYIGFSGSTGWASNYHRIDQLQILQQCIVQ